MSTNQKKNKISFPSAYTVILIVMILVMGLTYLIPAGKYSKLTYDGEINKFVVESPVGDTKEYDATQKTLDDLGVNTQVEKFTDGSIYKPVAIPGTYENVERKSPTGISAITQPIGQLINAPIQGLYDSIDIIAFVLVIGGLVGVINHTGSFTAGINSLSKSLKGHEAWLIVIITSLIALGGTTFGLAEETIAFYPIIVPVFLAAGYDALVAIAAIYIGSSIGTMASTVNPFSTIIASNTAGINWTDGMGLKVAMLLIGTIICIIYITRYAEKVKKDPTKSLVYTQKTEIEERFLSDYDESNIPDFNIRRKIVLILFAAAFGIMIYGVKELGWWFQEMTALFFGVALLMIPFAKLKEKEFVGEFVRGASELLGVALIIGLARGVTIVMDNGMISDTILNGLSNVVSGMSGILFSTTMFIVYNILGFFISSSSGLAVLSMPIMAPLADVVGVGRDVVVNAYQYGLGLITFITPTGLILASLAMVGITYDKWLKFVMPLVGIIAALSIVLLGIGVMM